MGNLIGDGYSLEDVVNSFQNYHDAALAHFHAESGRVCVYWTVSYDNEGLIEDDFSGLDGRCHELDDLTFWHTGDDVWKLAFVGERELTEQLTGCLAIHINWRNERPSDDTLSKLLLETVMMFLDSSFADI